MSGGKTVGELVHRLGGIGFLGHVRIHGRGDNHTGHVAHQRIDQLGIILGILGSDVLPVEFNAVTAIRGKPALDVGHERREKFLGRRDGLQVTLSLGAANGNDELHAVLLGELDQILEVRGIVFVNGLIEALYERRENRYRWSWNLGPGRSQKIYH